MHIYFHGEIVLLLTHIKWFTMPITKIQTPKALFFLFLFDKDYGPQHRSSNILHCNTVNTSSNIIHTVGATFPAFGVAFHCLIS